MPASRTVVLGEVLVDLDAGGAGGGSPRTVRAHAGGGPANVALGLARLGAPVCFAGRFSRHDPGPWLAARLEEGGVDLSASVDADRPATLAWVGIGAGGDASYSFYGPGTADWHWVPDELPDLARLGAAALHTGSLACATPPGRDVLARWVQQLRTGGEVLVSYDPNVRSGADGDLRGIVERFAGASHLVKVSHDDLAALYPGRAVLESAADWAGRGPELVVVTSGAGGSTALRPDGTRVHRRSPTVTGLVDTVGAGDAFCAGLLAWLGEAGALRPGGPGGLSEGDLASALDVANAVAARTCQRAGADPPTRQEVSTSPWPAT